MAGRDASGSSVHLAAHELWALKAAERSIWKALDSVTDLSSSERAELASASAALDSMASGGADFDFSELSALDKKALAEAAGTLRRVADNVLDGDEAAKLRHARPAVRRFLDAIAIGTEPADVRLGANFLHALTVLLAGIIGSGTVMMAALVTGYSGSITATARAPLYYAAFGDVLQGLAVLLLAATAGVLVLQSLRLIVLWTRSVGVAWSSVVAAVAIDLAVIAQPGYEATKAGYCTATAMTMDLPSTETLGGWADFAFDCRDDLERWTRHASRSADSP